MSNEFYYHGYFMSKTKGVTGRHTRPFKMSAPLEYGDDIVAVEEWVAKELKADTAMLVSWQELKGFERPKAEGVKQ